MLVVPNTGQLCYLEDSIREVGNEPTERRDTLAPGGLVALYRRTVLVPIFVCIEVTWFDHVVISGTLLLGSRLTVVKCTGP